MNSNDLDGLFSHIEDLKVLILGDLMLDHYIWGDVRRISPEAPVPIVNAKRETWSAGGAANVASNVSALGAAAWVAGSIGDDEGGGRLRMLLSSKGVELVSNREGDQLTKTIVKTRVVARNQQICRIDREEHFESYKLSLNASFGKRLFEIVSQVDVVIISDYAKGVVTQELLEAIGRLRPEAPPFLAVDPKPTRSLDFGKIDLLTPNKMEALQLAGLDQQLLESFPLEIVCKRIFDRFRPNYLVVTLGSEGMAVSREGKVERVLPTFAKEVFDVSGAGDTVIAVLACALAAGASLVESASFANTAAGCVVSHFGTVPIDLAEFKSALSLHRP